MERGGGTFLASRYLVEDASDASSRRRGNVKREFDMETDLAYEPLTESETKAAGSIFRAVLTTHRIMETVDGFHAVGIRCAVIIAQKDGALEGVRILEQHSVTKDFPFDEIAFNIANYDIQKHICIVLVRNNAVCSALVDRG